jgi:hypothetical protein
MVCFLGGKVASTESECQEFMDLCIGVAEKNFPCTNNEGMYVGEEPLVLIGGWVALRAGVGVLERRQYLPYSGI